MIPQSKGKMFLSAERGFTETEWFRSYNTFRFGSYQHPDKAPFQSLYVLNNDTLAGGRSFQLITEEDTDIILIPTVGAIRYSDSFGNRTLIEAGQSQQFTTPKGTTLTFENPYEEDLVNFLQLWFKKQPGDQNLPLKTARFDIDANKNSLIRFFPEVPERGNRFSIGKFKGRKEVIYPLPAGKALFLYVLEGAFEAAYRLLETGDSLALWDNAEVEIEALSNDAILLAVELPASF